MKQIPINDINPGDADNVLLWISNTAELKLRKAHIRETGSADEGITRPSMVDVNGERYFRKDSRNIDNSDDIEMIINFIGRYLGIKMAHEERCLSRSGSAESFLSRDVTDGSTSSFYSMREAAGFISGLPCVDKNAIAKWRDEYKHLNRPAYPECKEAFELRAGDNTEVAMVIRYGLLVCSVLEKADMTDPRVFRNDYFNMLFLDFLTSQVDRTQGNYGVLYDKQKNHIDFAPLFDNATLKKPYTEDGVCMVNGYICNRDTVFQELAVYDDFRAMAARAIEKEDQLMRHLEVLSEVFLEEWQKNLLLGNLKEGFDYLRTI